MQIRISSDNDIFDFIEPEKINPIKHWKDKKRQLIQKATYKTRRNINKKRERILNETKFQ